jgi:hypothetical protein
MNQIVLPKRTSRLRAAAKAQSPAILCASAPAFCYLLARPYAETGICDDWSYIKMAQVLAQTGHVVYNGWETPMLGWQLFLGAAMARLFGFSFTAVRLSTLIVAMATAYLVQRTFVRAGIRPWNATLATMTFVLSPMFVPLAFGFMTDISGVFCTVLCLYMCLRAVQAGTENSMTAWISVAAMLNALGGTARQTAWLGVLVMVPSTLWLLRRRRRVLMIGGLSCVVAIGLVFAFTRWFSREPYTIPEQFTFGAFDLKSVENIVAMTMRGIAALLLLLLPVLLMFVAPLRRANRRMVVVLAAGSLSFAAMGLVLFLHHGLDHWLAPFLDGYVSARGLVDVHSIMGPRPVILDDGFRVLLTVATVLGLLSLMAVFFGKIPGLPSLPNRPASLSWLNLGMILSPFSMGYIALLAYRASFGGFNDRYLLPLVVLTLLVLVRYYQEAVKPELPIASAVLLGFLACFSIAATHDVFAMYRGYIAAIDEVRSSGLPATAINGSWENDGWTQIEAAGFVNDPGIKVPRGAYVFHPVSVFPAGCDGHSMDRVPAVKPVYALSFDATQCEGPAAFPPVTYRTWLSPHVTSIYIVKFPASLRQ